MKWRYLCKRTTYAAIRQVQPPVILSMRTLPNILGIFLFLLTVMSCKEQAQTEPVSDEAQTVVEPKDAVLDKLFTMMQGSFNSGKQAQADSSYFDISLHMAPIWPEQGNFLYVEQAVSANQDQPYRQRVYKLERMDDTRIGSIVYEIPNDSLWIGKWKTPEAFSSLSPDDLEIRQGCTVFLQATADGGFSGSTNEMSCLSSLRGASYATSKVSVYADRIESWDQGFDAEGNQVWGAEKGGYVFDKADATESNPSE